MRNPAFQMLIPEWQKRFVTRVLACIDTSGGVDACWPWQGLRDKDGYGFIYDPRHDSNRRAHRIIWDLLGLGELDATTMLLHSCDNPPCVNVRHLRTGDVLMNARDKNERDRWRGTPRKRVVLQCQICAGMYEVTWARRDKSKYCSRTCNGKAHTQRIITQRGPGNAASRIPVLCLETNQAFSSLGAAAAALSLPMATLSRHIHGHVSHVKGYTFARDPRYAGLLALFEETA